MLKLVFVIVVVAYIYMYFGKLDVNPNSKLRHSTWQQNLGLCAKLRNKVGGLKENILKSSLTIGLNLDIAPIDCPIHFPISR